MDVTPINDRAAFFEWARLNDLDLTSSELSLFADEFLTGSLSMGQAQTRIARVRLGLKPTSDELVYVVTGTYDVPCFSRVCRTRKSVAEAFSEFIEQVADVELSDEVLEGHFARVMDGDGDLSEVLSCLWFDVNVATLQP